jgi:hypothetical protein
MTGERRLQRRFDAGEPLACGADVADRPGVRRLVVITRRADGAAIAHVETFLNGDWDDTLEEEDHVLPDLRAAIAWLAERYAVKASSLRAPAP